MRPISEATARVSGESFKRKYIALGRIVKHWDEIVGENLSTKAQPVKIHYRKKDQGQKPDIRLDIAASSADATLLHYQKDLILERINQIFGEQWISAIRFVQTPANQKPLSIKKAKISLTNTEKNTLSSLLAPVGDSDIRDRLERLGQAIVTDSKT